MLFHTHLLFGVVFFLFSQKFFTGGNEFIFFLFVLLGSILPDLDEKNSRINRWGGILGNVISFLAKHRGILHSAAFAVVLFFSMKMLLGNYYATGLFIGYSAHLIADSITPHGTKLFYPFSRININGPVRVGGYGEIVIIVMLLIVIAKVMFF